MNLKQKILEYIPRNEQEIKDKEMFIKYIEMFDDVLTRDNEVVHFVSSGFVVNKDRTKVLMVHHNIFNSWCWTGGHVDGETDFLSVAIREVEEETGVKNINVISKEIYTIDTLPFIGHVRNGKYVPAHVHLSVAYLLEADEKEDIRIQADENSNVKWIDIDEVAKMHYIYDKIVNLIRKNKQ